MVGLMNAGVTDIAQARAKRADGVVSLKREPLTIICQAANIRADGEVHRQIGFSDALTFTEHRDTLDYLEAKIRTQFGRADSAFESIQ